MTEEKKPQRKRAPAKKKAAPKKRAPRKPTGKPVGRPPFEVTEVVIEMARELASGGLTKLSIAAGLGISYDTLNEKCKEFPKFSEAIRIGQAQAVQAVENARFRLALQGNHHAQDKFLNNRHPEEWQDKRTIEAGDNLATSLQSMRPEDRLALLDEKQAFNDAN